MYDKKAEYGKKISNFKVGKRTLKNLFKACLENNRVRSACTRFFSAAAGLILSNQYNHLTTTNTTKR